MRNFFNALVAIALLAAWPAAAQVQMSGTFVADRSCPATQAIKGNKNPGNVQTAQGQGYDLLGANKDQPTHYLIRVPDVQPPQRWVAIGCGHLGGAAAAGPAPAARPGNPAQANGKPEYILALSWQPAFCETKPDKTECKTMTGSRFDASHFTLHGLWPQPNGNFYCNVSTGDQRSDKPGSWADLPEVKLDAATRQELDHVMPGTASDLERHEWIKHGTCYGKDQQPYFSDALRLMRAVNQSQVRQLFAGSIGQQLTSVKIRAAFDQAFRSGAGNRVRIACVQGPGKGQRMITEITVGLSGPVTDDKSLADLIKAAAPTSNAGCTAGIVDAVGR